MRREMSSGIQRQQGVALIIVLLIVALVSILATEMASRLQLQVQRTINIKDNNQAYWYALGAEAFARKSIQTLIEEEGEKISLDQPWAQTFAYPLDGGGIQAELEDLQSCFNLNAILQGKPANNRDTTLAMDAFHDMLLAANIEEIDSYTAETVRDSLADWVDQDDNMRPYGGEDSEYESRIHPYLAANSLLASQSELRQINGVSAAWMNEILPLVCVIPDSDLLKVNINTITEERVALLAGLTGLDIDQANQLIGNRPQDGWDDVQDFLTDPAIQALNLSNTQQEWFDVTTEHFILHTKTRYNKSTFKLSTVFYATQSDGVSILKREFGEIE